MTLNSTPSTSDANLVEPDSPTVAIAHEWLVRYAGSERCVDELLRAFPGADVLTTLVRPSDLPERLRGARPSMLQRIPGATTHHEWLLPLMPLAWRLMSGPRDVDAVISSSHACAKAVRLEPSTPHLCYCYTPMRYAWDFGAERERFPRGSRTVARGLMAAFRRWDRGTVAKVTRFVGISRAVADRIRCFYGREAQVVHPPVRTDYFTPGGEREDGFLYVGRLNGYKRPDLVVEAFRELPYRLTVVGRGSMLPALRAAATANVEFRETVDDEELRSLYRRSRAMVYPVDEDFGIVMAEAQACGTPVISIDAGGALDIVEDGRTGWLMTGRGAEDLRAAVRLAAEEPLDPAEIRARAERFSSASYRQSMRTAVAEMIADPRPV